jgi:hypothetical protein
VDEAMPFCGRRKIVHPSEHSSDGSHRGQRSRVALLFRSGI